MQMFVFLPEHDALQMSAPLSLFFHLNNALFDIFGGIRLFDAWQMMKWMVVEKKESCLRSAGKSKSIFLRQIPGMFHHLVRPQL